MRDTEPALARQRPPSQGLASHRHGRQHSSQAWEPQRLELSSALTAAGLSLAGQQVRYFSQPGCPPVRNHARQAGHPRPGGGQRWGCGHGSAGRSPAVPASGGSVRKDSPGCQQRQGQVYSFPRLCHTSHGCLGQRTRTPAQNGEPGGARTPACFPWLLITWPQVPRLRQYVRSQMDVLVTSLRHGPTLQLKGGKVYSGLTCRGFSPL